MSNTTVILANAYEEYNNKKRQRKSFNRTTSLRNNSIEIKLVELGKYIISNKLLFAMLFLLIVSSAIFITFVIKEGSQFIIILSFICYVISMFCIVTRSEKEDIKNYNKNRRKYQKKLNGFKNVLKYEFKLDSKEKIEYILKECDETSKELPSNNNLVGKFLESWKNMIYPIITFGLGIILKLDDVKETISWQTIVIGITLAFVILIVSLGVLYAIQSIVDPFINSYKNRVNRLKKVLTDIYLRDYV